MNTGDEATGNKSASGGEAPLWLLIDGYNVIAPTAPPRNPADGRWLQREREQLIARLVQHLDPLTRPRTCVVFDAANPPPNRPHRYTVQEIDVRYAVDHAEADDLLEELIAAHSVPKKLAVVSSDHRVQTAAKRRGALALDSQAWLDDLTDGKVTLAFAPTDRLPSTAEPIDEKPIDDDEDVDDWMRKFGFDE